MATTSRQFSGATIKSFIQVVARLGLREGIEPKLTGKAREYLDRPPLTLSWVEGEDFDALLTAVHQVYGEQKMLQVMTEMTKQSLAPLLGPLARTIINLFGASPVTVLGRLDKLAELVLRGAKTEYRSEREGEAELQIRTVDRPALAWFRAQPAALLYVLDFCETIGSVESILIDPDGRGAKYKLRWVRKPK